LDIPEHLREEQKQVEEEICRAFRGVRREGGVSWSESVVIDLYGSDERRREARAGDLEAGWEELVDDPGWNADKGVGGFTFLDPIGLRYYLAPALIRWSKGIGDGTGMRVLNEDTARDQKRTELLNVPQRAAVAKFLAYMIRWHESEGWECKDLKEALWDFLNGPT
jgi:hypothetical protein